MANPNDEEIDYISGLPDAILSAILSLLPTVSAVQTGRLSKRWKYVWTKVPVIDFSEWPYVLSIPKFREELFYILDNENESLDAISSLLDVIRWRQFCELHIHLFGDLAPLPLPKEFLFGQSSLVVLKLDGICIDDPQLSLDLPKLETVHFGHNFVFPCDAFLKRFLLGCPVLKNLYVRGGRGLGHIYVESSTLMSLEIRYLDEPGICITIKTPNLTYLVLYDADAHYDIIDDLSLLTNANIYLPDGIDDGSVQLLQKVSQTNTLRLHIYYLIHFVDKLPKFENMTQLTFTNYCCAYELLKRAPKLKSFILDNVGLGLDKFRDSKVVPECLSCLEKVELYWLVKADTEVAEYFLKNGTALKEMIVIVKEDVSIECCRTLRQKLLDCPTLSPVCQVKVLKKGLRCKEVA